MCKKMSKTERRNLGTVCWKMEDEKILRNRTDDILGPT